MDAEPNRDGSAAFLSSDRLASLSDTMFGVSMTLLATTLIPRVENFTGSGLEMLHDLSGAFAAVMLSFAIAGTYWVSQQRRLAMTRSVTSRQTLLHLTFLFLIVLLPISIGFYSREGAERTVVITYSAHLALIAAVNLLLWLEVHRTAAAHTRIVGSSLVLAVFLAALAVGIVRPAIVPLIWIGAFLVPMLSKPLTRWFHEK